MAMVYRPESHAHDAPLRGIFLNAETSAVLQIREFQELALWDKILRWAAISAAKQEPAHALSASLRRG